MVKPLNGPYKDWMFEAGSSQQADDDLEWLYCGIIYAYNVTHVNLFAPRSNGRGEGGRAFCIGIDKGIDIRKIDKDVKHT